MQVAKALGRDKSVICRELRRNRHEWGNYAYRDAQQQAEIRKERVRREGLWPPEQIAGRCRVQGIPMVGAARIYEFIRKDRAEEKTWVQKPNEVFCASLLSQQKLHLLVQSA